jgi:HTH-type transcriptional regulator / antitoxin HigA
MERQTMNAQVKRLVTHFSALQRDVPLHPIRTQKDYNAAVTSMNMLLDAGAADEKHPLANLVATLGELIGDYDDEHYPSPEVSGVEVLRFLMQQHGLKQTDLPEIGTQGVVSEILHGKREINLRQVKKLKERFGISADAFA